MNLTRSQAELMIAGISSMFTILVSSNTVAILLTSNIAKRLAQRYNIAPHRSAYLLEYLLRSQKVSYLMVLKYC